MDLAAATRASSGKSHTRSDRDSGNGSSHFKRPRPNYPITTPTPYKDHRVAKMGTGGSSGGSGGGGGFPKAANNRACYYCKVHREKYLRHLI